MVTDNVGKLLSSVLAGKLHSVLSCLSLYL